MSFFEELEELIEESGGEGASLALNLAFTEPLLLTSAVGLEPMNSTLGTTPNARTGASVGGQGEGGFGLETHAGPKDTVGAVQAQTPVDGAVCGVSEAWQGSYAATHSQQRHEKQSQHPQQQQAAGPKPAQKKKTRRRRRGKACRRCHSSKRKCVPQGSGTACKRCSRLNFECVWDHLAHEGEGGKQLGAMSKASGSKRDGDHGSDKMKMVSPEEGGGGGAGAGSSGGGLVLDPMSISQGSMSTSFMSMSSSMMSMSSGHMSMNISTSSMSMNVSTGSMAMSNGSIAAVGAKRPRTADGKAGIDKAQKLLDGSGAESPSARMAIPLSGAGAGAEAEAEFLAAALAVGDMSPVGILLGRYATMLRTMLDSGTATADGLAMEVEIPKSFGGAQATATVLLMVSLACGALAVGDLQASDRLAQVSGEFVDELVGQPSVESVLCLVLMSLLASDGDQAEAIKLGALGYGLSISLGLTQPYVANPTVMGSLQTSAAIATLYKTMMVGGSGMGVMMDGVVYMCLETAVPLTVRVLRSIAASHLSDSVKLQAMRMYKLFARMVGLTSCSEPLPDPQTRAAEELFEVLDGSSYVDRVLALGEIADNDADLRKRLVEYGMWFDNVTYQVRTQQEAQGLKASVSPTILVQSMPYRLFLDVFGGGPDSRTAAQSSILRVGMDFVTRPEVLMQATHTQLSSLILLSLYAVVFAHTPSLVTMFVPRLLIGLKMTNAVVARCLLTILESDTVQDHLTQHGAAAAEKRL